MRKLVTKNIQKLPKLTSEVGYPFMWDQCYETFLLNLMAA